MSTILEKVATRPEMFNFLPYVYRRSYVFTCK